MARLRPPTLTALPVASLGVAIGGIAALSLPSPLGPALALLATGAGMIGGLALLARKQSADREQLFAAIGEVKIRLATNAIRLDALSQRAGPAPAVDGETVPSRAVLNELTAEVGLLGDLVQQLATTLGDHDHQITNLRRAQAQAEQDAHAPVALLRRPEPVVPAPVAATVRPEPPPAAPVVRVAEREPDPNAERSGRALADGKVEIHLQPIVALPQRRTRGYEALVRLRLDETTLLQPGDFLGTIEERGFGPTLDALVLTRALAIARHLASKQGELFVTCGFGAASWGSTRALATLARIVEKYRDHAGRLVISMPQPVFRALDPTSLGLLGAMSANGVRFAIDSLSDLRLDPVALFDRGVRFAKAPAGLLLAAAERPNTDIAVSDLASLLARASISLVADGIGDDPTVADMLDLGVAMAQGDVFSPPRPVKPEVFAEPGEAVVPAPARDEAAPASATVEQLPQRQATPAPGSERMSLRAALLRASA